MSNPHDSADSQQDELQFDEAEYTEPAHAVTTCTACQTPITDLYYEAGGKIVCDPCRHKIEAMFQGGSRLGRAFKALIMGTIAAVAGAVLYYAILKITGRNFGLVAIIVGLMVGGAVKAGSGNRGGWFYQLMALFLTYSAIVAMLVPVVFEQFQEKQKKDQAQLEEILRKARVEAKAEVKKNSDKPEVVAPKTKDAREVNEKTSQTKTKVADKAPTPGDAPKAVTADPKVSRTVNPATQPAATKEAPEPAGRAGNVGNEPDDDHDDDADMVDLNLNAGLNPAFAVLAVMALILLAYSFPIVAAIGSPISGFIFAFALWEAWKMNRKVRLEINGPFHLAADQPLDLAAEDLDDEQ